MNSIEVIVEMIKIDKEEWVCTKIIIDEEPLVDFNKYAVNYWGLIKSIKKSGIRRILTCHCGVSGCAGIDTGIEVSFIGKTVEWLCYEPYPIGGKHFIFDRNLYVKAIRVGVEKLRDILTSARLDGKQLADYPDSNVLSPEKYFYIIPYGEKIVFNRNWHKIKRGTY